MAILIGAPASGAGKTTITLAILAALKQRGLKLQSFKVGPDYIDPMFHRAITGVPCRTLDPFLTSDAYVQWCFAHYSQGTDGTVIEGVMGLFDGQVNPSPDQPADFASTAHVARLLDLPVVLVIDAAHMGRSVAAVVYGLVHYDPRLHIAGVILNRVGSERHGEILQQALQSLGIPLLGLIHGDDTLALPSRHLGLVPAGELTTFQSTQALLADLAEQSLDWEQLLPLIQSPTPFPTELPFPTTTNPPVSPQLRVGVAWDQAFNFYYADNFDLLRRQGVELTFFSPLKEGFEPVRLCHGLYLGGGFPEIFAAELSEQLRGFHGQIPPLYAECGGLMILGRSLQDLKGETHPMMGLLPLHARMSPRLTLGYRSALVLRPTPALLPGQWVRGHEFHRSVVEPPPAQPIYRWQQTLEGWATDRIHASYLHVHWGAQPQMLRRFLQSLRAV